MKTSRKIIAFFLAAAMVVGGFSHPLLSGAGAGVLFAYAAENVALHKSVEHSAVDPETPGLTGDKVTDGEAIGTTDVTEGRWSGGICKAGIAGNAEQWLVIDLKAEKTVAQSVSVYWYKLVWCTNYKIQTRAGKSGDWTDIYSASNADRAGNVQNPTDGISGSDIGEMQRYVRFYFPAGSLNPAAAGHRISIREIEIAGAQEGVIEDVSSAQEALGRIPDSMTADADADSLSFPQVPGYEFKVHGSEAACLVSEADGEENGKISPYRIGDRDINVIVQAVSESDPQDTAKKDVEVTVKGNTGAYPDLFPQAANQNPVPSVLPTLQEWYGYEGAFTLSEDTKILVNDAANAGLMQVAEDMRADLEEICGRKLLVERADAGSAGNIYLESLPQDIYGTGEEGYFLVNGDAGIQIFSHTKTGALYGTVTIEQILYQDPARMLVPKGVIRDYPLHGVRGMMFDVARIPTRMQFLQDYAKILKWYKMNTMHLHLNDTQWSEPVRNSGDPATYANVDASHRLESELFPSLAKQRTKFEMAETRKPDGSVKYRGDYEGRYDYYYGSHTGREGEELYYTKDEYRSLQAAAERSGIKLIAELDTPGHATPYNKYVYNNQKEVITSLAERGYLERGEYLNGDGTVKKNFYTHNPNNFEVFSVDDESGDAQIRQNAVHAKIFIKALFDEYLGGIEGIDPLFTTDTVHAGVDEYWDKSGNNVKAFRRYMNEMYDFLAGDGYGKEVGMWGGLKYMSGSAEQNIEVNKNIILYLWNTSYDDDAIDRLNEGFNLINVPQPYFYTTPGRYHKDMVRENYLYYNWEPEIFNDSKRAKKGDPQLLGAMGALWGDANRSGTTEADLNERYLRSAALMSEKAWGGTKESDTFLSYSQALDRLREGPGTQIAHEIESKTNIVLDYQFENLSKDGATIYDASGNGYDGTVTGGEVIKTDGEAMLKFDGGTKIETPLTSLGYPYTMSFDVYLDGADVNDENSALFSGYDGRLQAAGRNGSLGINRSHFTQSFDYPLEIGKKHRISIVGTYQATKLYVDGEFQKILYAAGRDADRDGQVENEAWTDKDENFATTFVFPLDAIGDRFQGRLGNIRAYNKALSVEEFAMEETSGAAPADVARNRGAYSDLGNPAFWDDHMRLYPAWKATDGDGNVTGAAGDAASASCESRWNSSDRNDDYLMIDLGKSRKVSKVVIDWEKNRYAAAYKILVSDDGREWQEAKSVTGNTSPLTSDTFPQKEARYVKMQGVARKSGSNEYSIYEMKVYEDTDKAKLAALSLTVGRALEEKQIGWEAAGKDKDLFEQSVLSKAVLADVLAGQGEIDAAREGLDAAYQAWQAQGGEEPGSCRVTFESGGGTVIEPLVVRSGEEIDEPEKPEKAGYELKGWSRTENGEIVTWPQTITDDVTFYAVWEKRPEAEEQKEALQTKIKDFEKLNISAYPKAAQDAFRKAISDARAVFERPDATKEELEDAIKKLDAALATLKKSGSSVSAKTFTVTFSGNGTTVKVPAKMTGVKSGTRIGKPVSVPIRAGYSFLGWSRTLNGTVVTWPQTITANTAFYAVWKKNETGPVFADGEVMKDKKFSYKVISAKKKTAMVTGGMNKKASSISIPATVKIYGTTCKVVSIGTGAFKGYGKLSKVMIGKNVTTIGKNAFSGCKKLSGITLKGKTLKSVKSGAFKGTSKKLAVKVPKGMKKAQKKKLLQKLKKGGNKKIKVK